MDQKQDILVNRVANSPLKTINLENLYPEGDMVDFDLKPLLFKGLLLKEKDFRSQLKEMDWAFFNEKIVCVFCSSDAIIPLWAYMLVASYLNDNCIRSFLGNQTSFLEHYYVNTIKNTDWSQYQNAMIVIKGCSNKPVPPQAYYEITDILKPIAKSIMFGEACSTVPVYKRPKK